MFYNGKSPNFGVRLTWAQVLEVPLIAVWSWVGSFTSLSHRLLRTQMRVIKPPPRIGFED